MSLECLPHEVHQSQDSLNQNADYSVDRVMRFFMLEAKYMYFWLLFLFLYFAVSIVER